MSIIEVGVAELESALSAGARLIDVREAHEYEAGHVAGARHVPLSTVPEQLAAFHGDGASYVICHSGGRSLRVCEFLAQQGLDAINVAGGTAAWVAAGRPVVSGSRPL
ncbi:MAG: rhodanese-like domain-containing protein [Ilumatobacteraceae bacterium]